MDLLPKGRSVNWVVSFAFACVLVLLGVMQYRWSREVSEATLTRMRAGLRGAMMNFRQDLSRQLGFMCLDLETEASKLNPDARKLTQSIRNWETANALPFLVSNLYLAKSGDDDDTILLFQLEPAQGRFARVAWPQSFTKVRESIRADSEILYLEGPATAAQILRGGSGSGRGPRIAGIDESIPLLVVPIRRGSNFSWLLLAIDRQVLAQSVFAQLAQRYFGDSSDYQLAIVDNSSSRARVFYSSDEGFGSEAPASMDASLNLFGPPTLGKPPGTPPSEEFFPGGAAGRENAARSIHWENGGTFDPIRFDPIRAGADFDWRIVARHRKGSVEAAVAELRVRNLEMSFGVLLVLATSLALILWTSQRAQRLATLQMDFVAGVSHELRTPVAAILSISDNLVDGIVSDQHQLERYGRLIRNQARQLNHLVEQVLRFSATRKASTSYTVRRVQIADVVGEAVENTSNLLNASGFRVEQRIEPGLPAVNADFGALSQCLQNLITNAIKYGGDDRWIGIDATRTQSEVQLTVKDRGIGIEPQELKHIFEPFYRSPKVAETQIHGTGLGLALAKSFAETMGGQLTVQSVPGKGSAFTIHLPYGSRSRELDSMETSEVRE